MPCPYFEPQRVVAQPQHSSARLPLIEEYDGACRAAMAPLAVPAERRFRCCNHGYSYGLCELLPPSAARASFRYTVLRQSAAALDILCIEEQDYAPRRWHSAHYLAATGALETDLADGSMRAQVLAFCRSYLERFPLAS
jgi:hypothetical protein